MWQMTKARARGPKRRAPTKVEDLDASNKESSKIAFPVKEVFASPEVKQSSSPRLSETLLRSSTKPNTPNKLFDLAPKFSPKLETPTPQKTEKIKPPTPAKSPLLKATSASSLRDAFIQQPSGTKSPLNERPLSLPEPSLSSPASISRISPREEYVPPTARRTSAIPNLHGLGEDERSTPVLKTRSWGAPVISKELPLPQKKDDEYLNEDDSLSPLEATRSRENDPSQIFSGFFIGPVTKIPKLDLDVSDILLANRTDTAEEVKSLKTELSEITGYGKLHSVPQEYENVLFDESMYVCIHTFKTPLGAKGTEVYLWSGDKVSEPAVEDALLFARKMARENDGKLVRLLL